MRALAGLSAKMERKLDRILRLLYSFAVGLCIVIRKELVNLFFTQFGFVLLLFFSGHSFGPSFRAEIAAVVIGGSIRL